MHDQVVVTAGAELGMILARGTVGLAGHAGSIPAICKGEYKNQTHYKHA